MKLFLLCDFHALLIVALLTGTKILPFRQETKESPDPSLSQLLGRVQDLVEEKVRVHQMEKPERISGSLIEVP